MKKYYLLPLLLLLAASCEEWLDVKPRAQIEADVLYQREAGFKDVLYTAYINMISPEMYGREMTYGLVDVLGNVYPSVGTAEYAEAHAGNYTYSFLETMINAIWQTGYNTIANLNSLVEHLRVADRSLFSGDNYNVITGEALGLRAFLHFDLLRLFAPSFKAAPDALAIPYVTRYGHEITPDYTVAAVLDSILVDLNEAAALLHAADPLVTGRVITTLTDDGYLLDRHFRLNYHAVKATMAR
ncbi:MAG: RagB/SusD family nutrient uptake outer membrane protein, partial [Odoribacteraceae bacterium]|nr:RagB/SusD family nutrient uptake outer membrane protein [Odoribacteraceae bacterium]